MPDTLFAIFLVVVIFLFAGISVAALIRPSQYIRWSRNPWMADTPWNRLQMRAVGLVFTLFALMVLSGILRSSSKSDLLEGFHNNILISLWLAFLSVWVGGILSWILWRFSAFRILVRKHYDTEKLEDPAWERRMTRTFFSLLLLIVVIALVLAAKGYHP
jgi:hypothetical protein